MKEFTITHLFSDLPSAPFTEQNPPDWLLREAYKWWWVAHVLTLDVGESIESDFNKIERTA